MDVLSDILNALRFQSCLYFTTDFRPPWGLSVPAYLNVARFHVVMSGACWIRVGADGAPQQLSAGDIILIPHGAPHTLSDVPQRPLVDVNDVLRDHGLDAHGCLVYGGLDEEGATRLVCGHFEFDEVEHSFLNALPSQIVVRNQASRPQSRLDSILRLVAEEARNSRPGGDFVLKRLTEVLFVQTVRTWNSDSDKLGHGLLAAIADRHVGRSLSAIHERADERWTVDTLAREAGLSRTVFAERFRDLVGESPMHYVTSWRMQRARLLLKESDFSIDRIAYEVGYESPASFARVFRRTTGQSPGAVRRAAH
ncbi:MAG: AraC family transcriptional regulator [Methyloligellaceae bacterium]